MIAVQLPATCSTLKSWVTALELIKHSSGLTYSCIKPCPSILDTLILHFFIEKTCPTTGLEKKTCIPACPLGNQLLHFDCPRPLFAPLLIMLLILWEDELSRPLPTGQEIFESFWIAQQKNLVCPRLLDGTFFEPCTRSPFLSDKHYIDFNFLSYYIKFFSNKIIVFDSNPVIMPDWPQVHVHIRLHQTWADFNWTLIVQCLQKNVTVIC